jgi:hypothetical protein
MHNCLILGSGRSGTSMIGGTLAAGGYFFGDKLIPPRPANPKGFFESGVVNNVNERILQKAMPNLRYGHRWLGLLSIAGIKNLHQDKLIKQDIKKLLAKTPFCYKDPRFCYTLPIWQPYLRNTKFICIFRHPTSTIHSIIKECNVAPYLRTMKINVKKAQNIWRLMYTHVVHLHCKHGEWLFVHYDQMFEHNMLTTIEGFLQTTVNKHFPEKQLKKPLKNNIKLEQETQDVYDTLCQLANYTKG